MAETLELRARARSIGEDFVIFMHDPSPIGQAELLEDLRISQDDLKHIRRN